jgi:hypothetical protein
MFILFSFSLFLHLPSRGTVVFIGPNCIAPLVCDPSNYINFKYILVTSNTHRAADGCLQRRIATIN